MTSNYDKIVESISALLDEVQQKNESLNKDNSIFILKKANQSLADASKVENPRSLWKEFWYEGEVCCLFSDSNLGKSIYAVQIANEISKTDKVLYFDFELTEKQFQLRYTSDKDGTLYTFSDNLIRGELDLDKLDPMTFEDDAVNEILKAALNAGCKIVIIDNLTYLCSAMENAEAAGLVMKNLIAIKKQYGFSFLIIHLREIFGQKSPRTILLEAKDSIICLTVYSPLDRVPRMKIFVISSSLKSVGVQRRSENSMSLLLRLKK